MLATYFQHIPVTAAALINICRFLLLAVLIFVIDACSHEQSLFTLPPPQAEAIPVVAKPAKSTPKNHTGLSEDTLYKLLLAEVAGQRGHLDLSVDNYLELAKKLKDAQLAERATRIAIFAKRDDKALEASRLWVDFQPENLEARQVLAATLIRKGQIDTAQQHLEAVLNAPGDEVNTDQKLRMIANLLSREEDQKAALVIMERLANQRKRDPNALFAYAILALRAGQVDKARSAMEELVRHNPTNTDFVTVYLNILQKTRETQTAIDWMKGQLNRYPKNFELRMLFARLLADSKRFDESRNQFEILARNDPHNPEVHYGLGLLYLQANRLEEARTHFTVLTKGKRYTNEARFYLGQIAETNNNFTAALDWYEGINNADQNYFDARINMVRILSRQGKTDTARDQLHSIATDTPQQAIRLMRVEGEILTDEGHYQDAMNLYNKALDGDHYDAEVLYARAMLAEKMGRFEILEKDLRHILEREPDNIQALNALGYSLADRTDRYHEALSLIKRALELSPNDYYILDSMGWVLYRLGRLDEAAEHLQRARELRNDPEVAAHLGEVLWVMGDQAGARRIWGTALQAKPDDKNLLEVIKKFAH